MLGEAIASPEGCSLRVLEFTNCDICHVGLCNLFSARPTMGAGIQELTVDGASVGDDGAEAIAYHLASPWCMMIALRLITCNICDAGAVAFGGALAANTTLKVLDLDMNDFGSMGGQAIGVGLQSNCTLEELVLSNSAGPMEESFAVAVGKALGGDSSTALRRLEAVLQPGALPAITAGLAGNTTLRELYIRTSESSDPATLKGLLHAVAHHPTL